MNKKYTYTYIYIIIFNNKINFNKCSFTHANTIKFQQKIKIHELCKY